MRSTTRLCYIRNCICVLSTKSQLISVPNPFLFQLLTFALYFFLFLLCARSNAIFFISPHAFMLTTDIRSCHELRSTAFPIREYLTFWLGLALSIYCSPTFFAVPFTLCNNSSRMCDLSGSSYVATEATGCGTSAVS